MALGGGTWTVQNKALPGAYINFVSNATANNFGERGTGCIGTVLDWFDDNLTECTASELQNSSLKIFGYPYNDSKLYFAREFFLHGKKLYVGNLGTGTKAGGKIGTASSNNVTAKKYGTRGNSIKVVISANVDNSSTYDVKVYLGTTLVNSYIGITKVDANTVSDYVDFKEVTISAAATITFTGGTNGTVDGTAVQAFLTKAEKKSFNAICICGNFDTDGYTEVAENNYSSLLQTFTKRMRDDVGVKFQCVVPYSTGTKPDYEGTVMLIQKFTSESTLGNGIIVPWVCGALAGCAVNKSLTNTVYDGEFTLNADDEKTQTQLESGLSDGCFLFHYVGDELRVLEDINSLHTFSPDKGEIFKFNQTVRVCDQIAIDIAAIFNDYYLGKVQNDQSGRLSFWNEIVKHHQKLNDIRAIENFSGDDVTVEQGETKQAVVVNDVITVVNAMEKLYMTVNVQ